jgi:hypothetical protein
MGSDNDTPDSASHQNEEDDMLTEQAVQELKAAGFEIVTERVPLETLETGELQSGSEEPPEE